MNAPTTLPLRELSRRGFLSVCSAAGGALLLGVRLPAAASAGAGTSAGSVAEPFAPNAFVRIAATGKVTVIVNKAEMGQGICTSLTMVLAEELDADWAQVGFEFAPVDPVYAHPGYGIQMTGGSTSTMGMTKPMREAGAAARAMLIAAAAAQWGVPETECTTQPGHVVHLKSQRRAGYGELCAAAARLPVPDKVTLKEPAQWRLIGKPTHRLDSRDKVDGTAQFAIDVRRPGMLVAVVAHGPGFTARVRSVRDEAARRIPGVRDVINLDNAVAVVATGFWAAQRGRDALAIEWDPGEGGGLSSDALRAQYRELARKPGLVARNDGDVAKAFADGKVLEADFELPYLAHAPMEPLNCVAEVTDDSCEIWAGTQFQTVDHAAACRVTGLPGDKVKLHTTFLGGGFGRRANPASDYIVEAVRIAKAMKAPVQLIWTRSDDMRGGYYRPMWHSRIAAAHDGSKITGWQHTIVGQSFIAGTPFEPFIIKNGIDHTSTEGAEDVPYTIPNVRVELHTTKVPVPTLWWRSVGHSHTAFVVECFLDELAAALHQDPLTLRRQLLADKPQHLAVLELAAAKAGWGSALPAGHAHGLAVHHSFNSFVAMVFEVSLQNGWPRVHRAVCAVDCGSTINPDTVRAQLEGAVGFGLTAALYNEITLKDGAVQQSNFHDYRMLRMHEMPAVEVHLIASEKPPTGVGEPGVPPVAPALANALFKLTGRPIRRLPIRKEDLA